MDIGMGTCGGRCRLVELPLELQSLILQYLHFKALSAFARTSHYNYKVVGFTLSSLHIAVFNKRIHGLLAALNDGCDSLLWDQAEEAPAGYRIVVPAQDHSLVAAENQAKREFFAQQQQQQQPPSVQRMNKILKQNASLKEILRAPLLADLLSLTVSTYGLLSTPLAIAMAGNLYRLRHLTLNFAHPYINDPVLPPRYWKTCPDINAEGSPAWNALAGFGDRYSLALRMMSLQTLSISRAAITSAQLAKWVDVCKELYELRLDMVTGVDKNFVARLASTQVKKGQDQSTLRFLSIKRCPGLHLRIKSDFEGIQQLVATGLRELNLRGCRNVDEKWLRELAEEQGWETGALPLKLIYADPCKEYTSAMVESNIHLEGGGVGGGHSLTRPLGMDIIEVHPAYMV